MKKLLPYSLALCFLLPIFARSCPDSSVDTRHDLSGSRPYPGTSAHPSDTTIYIKKDTTLNRYPAIRVEWQLLVNGVIAQKGVIPVLLLSSKHAAALHLPARLPVGNEEAFLRLVYRRPYTEHRSSSDHRPYTDHRPSSEKGKARPAPILTRLIPVRSWKGDYAIPPIGDLTFTDSNDIFTITSTTALLQFDKQTGWLLRYEANHLLLMGDTAGLRSALWPPATTAPHLQLFSTSTGSQLVIVRAEYTLPEVSSLLHMSYTINAAGDMLVGQSIEADTTRPGSDSTKHPPALPRFGMNWILPAGLDSITWYGPPSWITSSPLSTSAITASPLSTSAITFSPIRTSAITASPLSASAITFSPIRTSAITSSSPADTGARNADFTGVRWWTITGSDGRGMRIIADSAFLHLHLGGQQLAIDRPMTTDPLPYGNYQYTYKISPVLPAPPTPSHGSHTPARAKRF